MTLLAVFKAGLAYVPLAPNWPEGRVRHVIEDAGPVMIITNMGRRTVSSLRTCIFGICIAIFACQISPMSCMTPKKTFR